MLLSRSVIFAVTVVVLCGSSSSVLAKLSLGLEVDYRLKDSTYEVKTDPSERNSTSENKQNNFSIIPYVGIRPIDFLEISPFFGLSIYSNRSTTDVDSTSFVDSKYKSVQAGIVPGIGLYFHVFKNSMLDISLGPKLKFWFYFKPSSKSESGTYSSETKYKQYQRMSMRLGGQVNVDFLISERVSLRLTSSLIEYYYYKYNIQYKDNKTVYTRKISNLDIQSLFHPSFGFQLNF